MAAPKRTVRVGMIAYRDPAGAVRRAPHGAVVEVHPDHVARFDRLNVLAGEEPEEHDDAVADPGPNPDDGDQGEGDTGGEQETPEPVVPIVVTTEAETPPVSEPAPQPTVEAEAPADAKPRRTARKS